MTKIKSTAPYPVCANCGGTGIEPSGNRYGDAVEMVGCHCCEGMGTVPTAEPVCANCHGRKVIKNLTQYGDIYDEEPCPDCAVPTAEPATLDPDDLRKRLTDWLGEIELSQAVFSLRGLKVSYTPDDLANLIVRVVGKDGAQ